ncbi:unnamed protein product [Parajaminaea phylloscopi]
MPAPLPFKSTNSHMLSTSARARTHDRNDLLHPPASSALEGWLRSQGSTEVPAASGGSRASGAYKDSGPAITSTGRSHRFDSEAGSAAGEGSIAGRSQGRLSSTGRRPKRGDRGKTASLTARDLSVGTSLWEAPELPTQSAATDLERWRSESAVPYSVAPSVGADAASQRSVGYRKSLEGSLLRGAARSGYMSAGRSVGRPPSDAGLSERNTRRSTRPAGGLSSATPLFNIEEVTSRPDPTPLRAIVRGLMKEGAPASTLVVAAILIAVFSQWAIAAIAETGQSRQGWNVIRLSIARSAQPLENWYTLDRAGNALHRPPLMGWLYRVCHRIASIHSPSATTLGAHTRKLDYADDRAANNLLATIGLVLQVACYTPPVLIFLGKRLSDRGRRTRVLAICTALHQPLLTLASFGLGGFHQIALGGSALCFSLLHTSLPNVEDTSESSAPLRSQLAGTSASSSTSKSTRLSQKVSYDYVVAATIFLWTACLDQNVICFGPVIVALMLGRWVGLAQIGLRRSAGFAGALFGVALTSTLLLLGPWLSWASPGGLRSLFINLASASAYATSDETMLLGTSASKVFPSAICRRFGGLCAWKQSLALVALALVVAFPCLVSFRAAKETVRIEMCLNDGLQASGPAAQTHLPNDGKRLPAASATATGAGFASSPPTPRKPPAGHRSPSVAPSEAESDLRSLAESIMRGGSSQAVAPRIANTSTTAVAAERSVRVSSSCPSPSAAVLPYAASTIGLAFCLFASPNLHQGDVRQISSLLLPLLPLTLLIVAKGDDWGGGANKADWQWAVFANNLGVFSVWPLLLSEGLKVPSILLLVVWNWLIGYRRPTGSPGERSRQSRSTIDLFFDLTDALMSAIIVTTTVLSLFMDTLDGGLLQQVTGIVSKTAFFVVYLWSMKRTAEVAIGNGLSIGIYASSARPEVIKRQKKA